MNPVHVKASGFFAFWTNAAWSDPVKLRDSFASLGMTGMEPGPLKPGPALREALMDHFRARHVLVRPLGNEKGFVVLHEKRGERDNSYTKLFSVQAQGEAGDSLAFEPLPEDAQAIALLYGKRLQSVPGHAVGSALVKIVDKLHGSAIRKTGGFYWMHSRHAALWGSIQKVVEGAALEGDAAVYMAMMRVDAESIRVVRDAIHREIKQESDAMLKEMLEGDIGERAMKTRLLHLDDLHAKIQEYETVVGASLSDLAAALDNVKTSTGLGAFQEMMREQVGV